MPRQRSWRFDLVYVGARTLGRVAIAALLMTAGCNTPTSPTPQPPPPPPPPPPVVVDPPTISCPPSVGDTATSDSGGSIIFAAPRVEAGEAPVTVSCSHTSGSLFPVGVTTVQCTATDARSRSSSCTFQVTLTPSPKIALTRFMAFGDSITAGEVTAPIGGGFPSMLPQFFTQIVVPTASYPTALQRQLVSRYLAQASSIQVFNEGLPGETAPNAVPRFTQTFGRLGPQAVLILSGYNGVSGPGGASGAAAAVSTMASEARNRGARVFIATLTPGKPGSREIPDFFLTNYNERMRQVARGEGAVLVDLYAALSVDVNAFIGIDGLHPNEAGYRKMADTFFAAIRADLER